MRRLLYLLPLLLLWACGGSQINVDGPDIPQSDSQDDQLPGDALFVDHLPDDALKVIMINIGQGDSILIQTPKGKNILIDAGPGKSKQKLVNFLRAQQIEALDLFLYTHPDEDHIGGAAEVIGQFPIKLILDSGYVKPTPPFEKMLAAIENAEIPVKSVKAGRNVKVEEGVNFEILAPGEKLFEGTRSDANANSIVFRLVYGDISFYFSGDSEAETEQLVLSQGVDLKSTVYKVAHHGSKHANQGPLLDAVQPMIALISAGKNNRFGHPTPEVIARLQERQVRILTTIDLGHIGLATDGKHLLLDTTKRDHIALFQGAGQKISDVANSIEAESEEPVVKVNINQATVEELVKVRGIGQKMAAKIIETREQLGGFKTYEDLKKIPGVGKKKFAKFKQLFELGPNNASDGPTSCLPADFDQAA